MISTSNKHDVAPNISVSNPYTSVSKPLALLFLGSTFALINTPATAAPYAYVERFEAVASDAAIPNTRYIHNIWGLHQPRIVRHNDGTLRLIYLHIKPGGNLISWHLMKRGVNGGWGQERWGYTTDDVGLVRDARNDRAHVVSWPNSKPYVHTSPNFTPVAIPGNWEYIPSTGRHYGNIGISLDGTMCLKVSREFYNYTPLTARSNTEYNCGLFNASANTWSWYGVVSRYIGERHAYDYIFPNPANLPQGLYATTTRDLHKTASETPKMQAYYGNYVFNGIRTYISNVNNTTRWVQAGHKLNLSSSTQTAVSNGQYVAPLIQRLHESYIDSKGRIFMSYYAHDPANSTIRGLYTTVTNTAGSIIFRTKWPLGFSGYTRIFEDSKSRLWMIWTNQGTRNTEVRLYPLLESVTNGVTSFRLGTPTNLDAKFKPYSIQAALYFAVPRGGHDRNMFIDAIFHSCWTPYQTGVNYNSANCYNSNNSAYQRVFYTRIRLPD